MTPCLDVGDWGNLHFSASALDAWYLFPCVAALPLLCTSSMLTVFQCDSSTRPVTVGLTTETDEDKTTTRFKFEPLIKDNQEIKLELHSAKLEME